jgi:hypothetical protein
LPAAFADKLSSTATATTMVELTVVHWQRKRDDFGRQGWDKDVLLFKRWRSRHQPPPAVTTLCDGWLLRSLLSRRSSEHHQQRTNGSTILFTFTFPVNLDLF